MAPLTPMMQQYFEIKEQHPDQILMFRLGDFYEMFFDDAKLASRELELTLTGRDCGQEERAPMCGVPFHSCEGYISRLVAKGYKVAICEQLEDPSQAVGIVKRDVVRIVTPGTITDSGALHEDRNNFIAAICLSADTAGFAVCDITTGEAYATNLTGSDLLQKAICEIGKYAPSELLCNPSAAQQKALTQFCGGRLQCMMTSGEEHAFSPDQYAFTLAARFGGNLQELGLDQAPGTVGALGALMSYLIETQKQDLSHINRLNFYTADQFMQLDLATRRNLELCETMLKKEKQGSLLDVLDRTKTAMGARMLRSFLERPLLSADSIRRRLDAVEELKNNPVARGDLADCLKEVYDLERLMSRVVCQTANGRDLRALERTLRLIPCIKSILATMQAPLLHTLCNQSDDLPDLYELIDRSIAEEPPFSLREGGVIRSGYSEELDQLRSLCTDTKSTIARLEQQLRDQTGIKNLKIGYNRVFGYYIEVTKSNLDQVPDTFIRKQTLANCERYIIQELKSFEQTVLGAQERSFSLEYELFCAVRDRIAQQLHLIQRTAAAAAQTDVLCALADCAQRYHYCKPTVDDSGVVQIKEGRHPVVERMNRESLFVPNDTDLDGKDRRLMLITGPNMGGKSTYMRQVALCVLLAQIGSFVPAKEARIGVVDRIFTRVGASDDLSAGQSTFMVEMSEVADILRHATPKSLVVYDEIGRGTSTYDGLAIAQAVLEFSAARQTLGAKVLFATHYHELTELADHLEGVHNFCVSVKKRGEDITFLRKVVPGAADDSYGIEVARLAGIPRPVIERARGVLRSIEQQARPTLRCPAGEENIEIPEALAAPRLGLAAVEKKLSAVEPDTLTPIEALQLIFTLKAALERKED